VEGQASYVENVDVETLSAAYDAEMWHELYVMVGGAAGAPCPSLS
jgi:hypothetical protein